MVKPVIWGAVQLSSQGDVSENLERVTVLVNEAVRRGASTVVLPENFAYMGDEEGKCALAEDLDPGFGTIAVRLSALARSAGVTLVAGGFPERSGDAVRPYNTCAVFGPDGALRARYRKIHLFDVETSDGTRYCESASTMAGREPVVVEVDGLRLGLSICYDLRFPELYRALSTAGAEAVVVPAAFTLLTGKDHWQVLLRARAIEAQVYVIAAAQWGRHPRGRATYGKSCIIDPWGEVIAQASEGEGVVTAALDPAYLSRVRASLPALEHRRL
ncbi:carbon-nitrogen hydrolase family protein [Chondromyces apiculatus]|uniref:Omega amidase n=1 Tax=Chondromyces apiculatus DSM 436 TaxID=1192034 RepID=A0A017T8W7_9BACT|nr:carbon-nitrogen hydrolase family protein [Chondromyces apiculatus]EYF05260.1 Omega amidase [Chondromyces apiculatus DSM 436]